MRSEARSSGGALSSSALVLAPTGRDAGIASSILQDAGVAVLICDDLADLERRVAEGAGLAVVVEEALRHGDLSAVRQWIEDQPSWSDFPFLLLTQRGGSVERNPAVRRLSLALGNVSVLERPFHPTTLVSAVRTALRGRSRQYEARERIEEIHRAEVMLELRVAERTAELEAANRQLASQIAERERAESDLRQAQRLDAVGQLTSGVAHDFNNLLTVLLGNLELMQKRTTDPALRRRLSMMNQAAERGAKLTAQMLAFSRRQKLEPRAVDLNDTVTGMRELLQSTIGGAVDIQPPQLAKGLWPAMIDPTQIELVILNLAINARDAMEVGGALTICTANVVMGEPQRVEEPPAGEYVAVSVADTGSGMTPEVLGRVFEPFFTTKDVGKGSGLGLSQVFGLAKQSGGGVSIVTEVGRGAVVTVYLPRASEAPATTAATPDTADTADTAMTVRLDDAVILLVDDDPAVREVTAGILADIGCHVIEAGSGGAALEAFEGLQRIDAVVLDFAMPGMNGAALAREIKVRRPRVPILFATGYADAEALQDFDQDRVLRKPYAQAELGRKLSSALATR